MNPERTLNADHEPRSKHRSPPAPRVLLMALHWHPSPLDELRIPDPLVRGGRPPSVRASCTRMPVRNLRRHRPALAGAPTSTPGPGPPLGQLLRRGDSGFASDAHWTRSSQPRSRRLPRAGVTRVIGIPLAAASSPRFHAGRINDAASRAARPASSFEAVESVHVHRPVIDRFRGARPRPPSQKATREA